MISIKILENDNINMKPHCHRDIEIIFPIRGEADQVYLEGEEIIGNTGDIIVVNSNEIHSLHVTTSKTLLAIFTLPYSNLIKVYSRFSGLSINWKKIYEEAGRCLIPSMKLKNILEQMISYHFSTDETDNLKIESLYYELLYLLIKDYTIENIGAALTSNAVSEEISMVLEYINNNYHEKITTRQLAQLCGFTPNYLSRRFKQQTGLGINEYLHGIRLSYAAKKLKETNKSILEIALDSGFANEKRMVKEFKDTYGMLPSKFRKYGLTDNIYKKDE